MVVPPFATLLADSTWQVLRNVCPFLRTAKVDDVQEQPVLDVSPWTFHKRRVKHLLPSVQALNVSATR